MAKLSEFIAFKATIELLKDTRQENIINDVYKKCKESENVNDQEIINHVKDIYKPFTSEQISAKIADLLHSENVNADIEIVYQSIDDLHAAIPDHKGDWYFTGNYPTVGGIRVANRSFINYIEGKNERAY
jgi:amidophosphoribosyltransferase